MKIMPHTCTFFYICSFIIQLLSHHTELPLYWWQRANGDKNFWRWAVSRHCRTHYCHEPRRANRFEKKLVALVLCYTLLKWRYYLGTGVKAQPLEQTNIILLNLMFALFEDPWPVHFAKTGHLCPEIYGDPALTLHYYFPSLSQHFHVII